MTPTQQSRLHDTQCVSFCTAEPDEDLTHSCWCREGGMTFQEFAQAHPRWTTMAQEDWFRTKEGEAWDADMRGMRA